MNDIKLKIYHPSLNILSDRTFRSLLKKLSAYCREIQIQEVSYLINSSDLSDREKQSIKDQVMPELGHMPSYYVDKIERGSLEIAISLTAIGIWLLEKTVGKSIEDAYLKSNFHKKTVKHLSTDLRDIFFERKLNTILENWRFDRFLVKKIDKKTDKKGNIEITIDLETPKFIEERIQDKSMIDAEFVIKETKKMISDLNKK